MNKLMLNQKCGKLVSSGAHAVRVMCADAILCAVCLGLYGMVFGGLRAQVRYELTTSGLVSITGTWAAIGLVIGASVGIVRIISRAIKFHQRSFVRKTRTVRFSEGFRTRLPRNALIMVAAKSQPRISALGG